jgi:hypothetical protein
MHSDIDVMAALQGKEKGGHFKVFTKFFIDEDKFILCGEIYGDTRWPDGHLVRTSKVVHHYVDECIVETKHTYYTLGQEVDHNIHSYNRNRLLSVL